MYDYAIVGGGIVGLTTAAALADRFPFLLEFLFWKKKTCSLSIRQAVIAE